MLTGDEIIGEILNNNSALIPITVMEFGYLVACLRDFSLGKR